MKNKMEPKETPEQLSKRKEELKQKLQEWMDAEFLCPSCHSHNNIMEVSDIESCHCAPECRVLLSNVRGQCNNCGLNYVGLLDAQQNCDDVRHAIEDRRMRHSLN